MALADTGASPAQRGMLHRRMQQLQRRLAGGEAAVYFDNLAQAAKPSMRCLRPLALQTMLAPHDLRRPLTNDGAGCLRVTGGHPR